MASALSRTASAALCADEPASTAWRLLNPPRPSAIAAVSPVVTATSAGARPSAAPTICASIVLVPCPMAAAPEATWTLPDGPDAHARALERAAAGALDEIGDADAEMPARLRAPSPAAPGNSAQPARASASAWQCG